MTLTDFLQRLKGVKKCGKGYIARCPAHGDKHQSLSISEKDGNILVKCHAGCSADAIVGALGLGLKDLFPDDRPPEKKGFKPDYNSREKPKRREDKRPKPWRQRGNIVASYEYRNDSGELLAVKDRYENKFMSWRHPDGSGGWLDGSGGREIPLYKHECIGNPVYLVEGEKDVDTLRAAGLYAVCNPNGAAENWKDHYTDQLKGFDVRVIPDNDDIGRKHADKVCNALIGAAASVKLVDLKELWPEIPNKGDVTDWFEWCRQQGWDDAKIAQCMTVYADGVPEFTPDAPTLEDLKPAINPKYKAGDIGNAALFADIFRDRARCIFETKQWYVFDGKRWIKDPQKLKVMELCKELADALIRYGTGLPEDENSKKFLESAMKWRNLNKRKAIIEDAASVHPVRMSEFDNAPYLFNCQNGTLNLETGGFYPHRASDMLTMLSGVAYDPAARCDRWESFISEIMQGDEEKALFLQKALGYAITGGTELECFFVLYGATTRNGKGTTMETFKHLMGDYGAAASPRTIARKDNADSRAPSEDIARLNGKRFVNLSEPDQGMVLSAATVKTMTGNDTINARFLHENSFEFVPQFKLFINTNHLPRVTDPTVFSSGRVKVIPFERHFEPEEQDNTLKKTLMNPKSLSGILNWCIEGLQRMQQEGLEAPASVSAATDEYQRSNDKIAMFFADQMEEDPEGEAIMEFVYGAYQTWCGRNGFRPTARNKFNAEVKRYCGDRARIKRGRPKGYSRDSNPATLLFGYRLLPDPIVS